MRQAAANIQAANAQLSSIVAAANAIKAQLDKVRAQLSATTDAKQRAAIQQQIDKLQADLQGAEAQETTLQAYIAKNTAVMNQANQALQILLAELNNRIAAKTTSASDVTIAKTAVAAIQGRPKAP